MENRRIIKLLLITFLNINVLYALNGDKNKNKNITFFVAADLHFDSPPESDQYYHVFAMNKICGEIKNSYSLLWPKEIDNLNTGFDCCGEKINIPNGGILVGDITDRAEPTALELFKTRYEIGQEAKQIHFPVYIGLGNHDLDPKHVEGYEKQYKNNLLDYLANRHFEKSAKVM
jgi:cytolysin (calcineurin-like family phosphatase)